MIAPSLTMWPYRLLSVASLSMPRWRAVSAQRDALAESLDLEPSVLASRALLDAMLRQAEAGAAPDEVPDLRGWQATLLLPIFE